MLREADTGPGTGHRVACHFYETLPAPPIAAAAGPAKGKFTDRLAAFEAAKAARAWSGRSIRWLLPRGRPWRRKSSFASYS